MSTTTNTTVLIGLTLQAMQQAQAYQLAVLKANAEGRDATADEVAAAKAEATAAIAALELQA